MFEDVAAKTGLHCTWTPKPRPFRILDSFGSGCAFLDYDQDGWQDVLLICDPHPRLFRNQSGRFEDVTTVGGFSPVISRVNGPDDCWTGCAVGDYDGDGFPDVLVTGIHCLTLLRNEGGQGFRDTTTTAGLSQDNQGQWGTSAGFMDLDGDQDLDLLILNYVTFGPDSRQFCEYRAGIKSPCSPLRYMPQFGQIWRNDGAGRFELVPATNGMETTNGVGMVVAFTDLNDDGLIDFYIGNDISPADLMQNQGDLRFENIGQPSGVAQPKLLPLAAMGADFGDYDRDGLFDLAVSDYQERGFALFHNEGSAVFNEVAHTARVAHATRDRLGFGTKWLDFENDGWPDLSFANGHVFPETALLTPGSTYRQPLCLLRNQGDGTFVDLVSGLPQAVRRTMVARGSATGDFNNDGRVDLLVVDVEGSAMLLENRSRKVHHWITLDLRAHPPNVFAHGAKITAQANGQLWVGEVAPASSYLSSSDPRIHWGLGSVERLDSLHIRWPDGQQQTLTGVAADQILAITQPTP